MWSKPLEQFLSSGFPLPNPYSAVVGKGRGRRGALKNKGRSVSPAPLPHSRWNPPRPTFTYIVLLRRVAQPEVTCPKRHHYTNHAHPTGSTLLLHFGALSSLTMATYAIKLVSAYRSHRRPVLVCFILESRVRTDLHLFCQVRRCTVHRAFHTLPTYSRRYKRATSKELNHPVSRFASTVYEPMSPLRWPRWPGPVAVEVDRCGSHPAPV